MTHYFVSRHPGALKWAKRDDVLKNAEMVEHLDIEKIKAGDVVTGTLPINMVANICELGAIYRHLVMNMSFEDRGKNLTPDQMADLGAHVKRYEVKSV